MTSSDEEMYHGDYSNEEHAESLEYTYDQDPGDAEQGYSEGEDDDEYGEESHSDHHDNDSEDDSDGHRSSDVDHNPPATAPSLEPYEPTVSDILQVRRFFTLIPVPLPEELVDTILDYASYWGHCSLTLTGIASVMGGSKMYMRTLPLAFPHAEGDFVVSNEELHGASTQSGRLVTRSDLSGTRLRTCPCRRIEFQLWGHEQIWILQTPPPEDPEAYRPARRGLMHASSHLVFRPKVQLSIGLPTSALALYLTCSSCRSALYRELWGRVARNPLSHKFRSISVGLGPLRIIKSPGIIWTVLSKIPRLRELQSPKDKTGRFETVTL